MRTKSVLTAGMLAMLMAACSNEELVTSNELAMDRPLAGDVNFVASFGGDVESRAQWNAGWDFEAGDKFGAYLMDTWNGGHSYTLVDYVHTNYPFMAEGTTPNLVWKSVSGAPLCEGNYFFAYPFKATWAQRGVMTYSVQDVQWAVDKDGNPSVLAAGEFNQRYLGYSFVEAEGGDVNNLTIKFDPIFASPKFKIKNSTNGAIRVEKVLIRAKEGRDIQKLPTTVHLMPSTGGFSRTAYEAGNTIQAMQDALVTDVENGMVYEYVIECGDNTVVAKDGYLRLAAFMPAKYNYGQLDVFLFVEDQDGDKEKSIVRLNETNKPEWCDRDQAASMQTNLIVGEQQIYTATIYDQSLGNIGVEGFTVVNSTDLEYVLKFKAEYGGKEMLKITTWGEGVELNQNIYALLAAENRKNIELYINGTIVIPANADPRAIDELSTNWDFANTTIINKGNQVLSKDVNANIINEGTITVAEGKTVTINGDVEVKDGSVTVTNINGDVEVKADAELTAETITGDLENAGSADIATVKGDVENNGTLTINNINGTLTNYAAVVAEGGKLHTVYNKIDATISVEGEVEVGAVKNEGNLIVIADAELSGSTINNYGIVDNFGTIANALKNQAQGVINNGTAARSANLPLIKNIAENNAVVNAYAGKIEYIFNNAYLHIWDSEIEVVTINDESKGTTVFEGVVAQHVDKGGVRAYRATAAAKLSELKDIYSLVVFNEFWTAYDLEFDIAGKSCSYKSWNKIVVTENAEVKFTATEASKYAKGMYTDYYFVALTVEKNAVLNIEDNSYIAFGQFNNNGEVHVASGSVFYVNSPKEAMTNPDGKYVGHQIIK